MDKELRLEFSGRLLIIDEAHNLRDVPGESADDNLDWREENRRRLVMRQLEDG
jgi:hypothetical protein